MPAKGNPYLLPRGVEPVEYALTLEPDFQKFTFGGSEVILIDVKKSTRDITLHALGLDIKRVALGPRDNNSLCQEPIPDEKRQTVTFSFARPIPLGRTTLYIEFEGQLTDALCGFYRTSYQVSGGQQWGGATQFEATDARRAFPCWDEPNRKARFRLTLVVPETMQALSNMQIGRETPLGDGKKQVVFETTPRMSTYLLAWVIANLECIEGVDCNGTPIRVWTTPGKKGYGQFALDVALHALPFFADWFGIPYVLPKLDMIALPDFAAGAMENWGVITYRGIYLLMDPANPSIAAKKRIAITVNHEIAHQWFGNLVTMQWWDDLWLNEGFASFVGELATHHQFPEWNVWTGFVAGDYQTALWKDALRTSHPIEAPVKDPSQINEIFDAISYSKGAAVLRMLLHFIGADAFRRGMQRYLEKHAYRNATTNDLWRALERASEKPVRAMMQLFTRQPGYPLVTLRGTQAKGRKTITATQQRFLLDGSKERKLSKWIVPLSFITDQRQTPVPQYMLRRIKVLERPAKCRWIKFNPDHTGLYRVAYPEDWLTRLTTAVEEGALSSRDRLGLLDDAFTLARAGYSTTAQALTLLDAYRHETDYYVWGTIANHLASLDNILVEETGAYDRFTHFARLFFYPVAAQKEWGPSPQDTDLDVLLRSLALSNLGRYHDTEIILEARERFARFLTRGELDPNLRSVVYNLVARYGGHDEFDALLELYQRNEDAEEKFRVLIALGQCHRKDLLAQFFNFCVSPAVRTQDAPVVMARAGAHPLGRTMGWEFVKDHWSLLTERYVGHGLNLFTRILEGITSGFTTRTAWEDVEAFFKTHPVNGAERTMKEVTEIVRARIAWIERDRDNITAYFENKRVDPRTSPHSSFGPHAVLLANRK